jgi:hypothetical protein
VKAKSTGSGGDRVDQRLPLVFGVSGHRDLVASAIPELRRQLLRIFSAFRAAYPHTPFQLLTPLAEGADRLAAEVALASGIDLFVPLPMEQQEYERDFATAKSLAEFRALLAMAKSKWEIPMAGKARTKDGTRQYAEVGELIARDSHVLILLWDGEENRKVGGTAWVRKRRELWVRERADLKTFVYGPTIQVVTPRVSGRLPRPRPTTVGELPPSAVEFAAALSKHLPQRSEKSRKRPPPYQLIFWANDRFNSGIAGFATARSRKKGQSATRSRL